MERLLELLAKPVGELSDEEITELAALLAPPNDDGEYPDGSVLGQIEDVDQLESDLLAAADARLDAEDSDDAVNAELEAIADGLDAAKTEKAKREAAEAEKQQRKDDLRKRIHGESDDDEQSDEDKSDDTDEQKSDDDADEQKSSDDDGDGDKDESTDADKEAITAGGGDKAPARKPVLRYPNAADRRPTRQTPVKQAALVASGAGGIPVGQRLADRDAVYRAWTAAVSVAELSDQSRVKLVVGRSKAEIPPDLQLSMNPEGNAEKLAKRASIKAIVAAGGVCAPVPYRYDIPTVGDSGRPVRDALNRFGAVRGGVRTFVPPVIDAVAGAFSTWTHANDLNPTDPTTKPKLVIPCDNTESTTMVYANTEQIQIGNFRERWFPEQVEAYQDLAAVYGARFGDSKLLAGIAAGSKTVTYNDGGAPAAAILSVAHDVFTALNTLIQGMRYRHRLDENVRIRVLGFEWVRTMIINDLIRQSDGARPLEERLRMARSEVDQFFSARGVNITWTPDFQFGQTGANPGAPFAGTQATGTQVIGFPAVARFYVFFEGSWLFLDGGELNLGVIRDSTLVGTNDLIMFSETFENVHYFGTPGESYNLDIHVCANGQSILPAGAITC